VLWAAPIFFQTPGQLFNDALSPRITGHQEQSRIAAQLRLIKMHKELPSNWSLQWLGLLGEFLWRLGVVGHTAVVSATASTLPDAFSSALQTLALNRRFCTGNLAIASFMNNPG
jgi:hypothetical protein